MKPLYARELGKGKFAGWMVKWVCSKCEMAKRKYGDEDDEWDRNEMYTPPPASGCRGPWLDRNCGDHDWYIDDEQDLADPDEM